MPQKISIALKNGEQFSYSEIEELDEEEVNLFFTEAPGLLSVEENPSFKLRIYRFLYLLGLKRTEFQTKSVYYLVFSGLSDKDAGNRKSVGQFLEVFPENAFSSGVRNRISSYVISSEIVSKEIVFLTARLQQNELIPHYQYLLSNKDLKPSEKWTYNVALGRLGDNSSAQWCLSQVQKIGLNDQVIQVLIPDLVFLRNRPAISFLFQSILKDEKRCSSPNPDSNGSINCAYRLMELVAPVVKDFPVRVDEAGSLEVDDYEEALEFVRQWIETTGSKWQFIDDKSA